MLPHADEVRAARAAAQRAERATQALAAVDAALAALAAHEAAGALPPDGMPGEALVAELAAWPGLASLPAAFTVAEGPLPARIGGRRTQLEVARAHLAPHADLMAAFGRLNAAFEAQRRALEADAWADARAELEARVRARDEAAARAAPAEAELARLDVLDRLLPAWVAEIGAEPSPARAAALASSYAGVSAQLLAPEEALEGLPLPDPRATTAELVAAFRALQGAARARRARLEEALAPDRAERDAAQAWLTENVG